MIAKLYPRMKNPSLVSLDENENLLNNTFVRLLLLVQGLEERLGLKGAIAQESKANYDIVISRWMGEHIKEFDKSKPVFEFHYCPLNDAWFFERFSHNDIQYVLGKDDLEMEQILGDIYFKIEAKKFEQVTKEDEPDTNETLTQSALTLREKVEQLFNYQTVIECSEDNECKVDKCNEESQCKNNNPDNSINDGEKTNTDC